VNCFVRTHVLLHCSCQNYWTQERKSKCFALQTRITWTDEKETLKQKEKAMKRGRGSRGCKDQRGSRVHIRTTTPKSDDC
jgi:hypothetical protein